MKHQDREERRPNSLYQDQGSDWQPPQNSIQQNGRDLSNSLAVSKLLPEPPDPDRKQSPMHRPSVTPRRVLRLRPCRPGKFCPPPAEAPKPSRSREQERETHLQCSLFRQTCTLRLLAQSSSFSI